MQKSQDLFYTLNHVPYLCFCTHVNHFEDFLGLKIPYSGCGTVPAGEGMQPICHFNLRQNQMMKIVQP
jgi:hypothetical protein